MESELMFSIITVSYNSAATIRRTIESVLNQDFINFEYLIIDGASTDDTVKIAEEYAVSFAEKGIVYKVSSEPDGGIYDAMNKGIARTEGKLVGIINSDDYYEPDALSTVAKTYEDKCFDYYFSDINLVKTDGSVLVKKAKIDRFPTSHHWNHPTCFVTKATYDELGVFKNEGIHDDFEFYLRIIRAGKKIVTGNKPLANFSMGGVSNDKSFKKCKKRCHDRFYAYRANGYSRLYWFECVAIEAVKWVLG